MNLKQHKLKTGLMGGSFNPFHLGHLNSLLTVKEQFKLDNIILIPCFKSPLGQKQESLKPFYRLEMLKKLSHLYHFIKVDDQEIQRKGISYTHSTVNNWFKKKEVGDLFFIMGLDQFYVFDKWKNFKSLLKKTNFIVTSRPGLLFPKNLEDFPKGLQALLKQYLTKEKQLKALLNYKPNKDKDLKSLLNYKSKKDKDLQNNPVFIKTEVQFNMTKNKMYFCELKDMDISSSYIRQRLKEGKSASHLLLKEVILYIKEKGLYKKT